MYFFFILSCRILLGIKKKYMPQTRDSGISLARMLKIGCFLLVGRCLALLKNMLPPADKVKQESHQVTKERVSVVYLPFFLQL